MVEKWEDDPVLNENPFAAVVPSTSAVPPTPHSRSDADPPVLAVTMAAVRRELAEEDAVMLDVGMTPPCHANMAPSVMIAAGLELEDQQ